MPLFITMTCSEQDCAGFFEFYPLCLAALLPFSLNKDFEGLTDVSAKGRAYPFSEIEGDS